MRRSSWVRSAAPRSVSAIVRTRRSPGLEERIGALGLRHAILAPVYFVENAFNPWNLAALASGRFPLPLPPDRALQQVAIADVADVAALVLERREDFAGRRVEIAGDELSGRRAAAAVTAAAGRHFAFHRSRSTPCHAACAGSSNGSRASATTSTSRPCAAHSRRSAGSASRTGRSRATGRRPRGLTPSAHQLAATGAATRRGGAPTSWTVTVTP